MDENKGYTIYHSDGSTKEVASEHTPIIDKLAADDSDKSINNFYDAKHIPSNTVKVEKDGTVQDYDVRSKEYKDLYNSGNLTSYNDKTNTYIATPMKPFEVSAKKQYDYEGCVAGLCNSLAEKYEQPVEEFRKLSNLYGDAWVFNKTNFGTDVDISKGYSNLKEGDVINLSRGAFSSDTKKGIPSKNQHVGYVSKIENGVPYVKHYITGVGTKSDGTSYGEYFEEPINNIKQKYAYTASGARRIDYNKNIEYKDSNFKFDDNYTPNTIEEGVAKAHSQKKELQNVLKLNSDEYDELAKVAYGIMGNESSYGRSTKTLYRMAVPDIIQKGVKVTHDLLRNKNVYDDNINNLSQGYSSTKESSLHGISSNTGKSREEVNKQIKSGDYTNLTRDNNYLYTAMNKLGINPDNLENGENATKAIMATLSWYKKRNPNATTEDLLKMYTGKKDITAYKASFDSYLKNINTNAADNKEYSWFDDLLGKASVLSNKASESSKQINSSMISYIRDKSPLPENVTALFSDLMGGIDTDPASLPELPSKSEMRLTPPEMLRLRSRR
jgi:hypothetical protein